MANDTPKPSEVDSNVGIDEACQVIDIDGDQIYVYGYEQNKTWMLIIWFFIVTTGGSLRLLLYWFPIWYLRATHDKCTLERATKVFVTQKLANKADRHFIESVYNLDIDEARSMMSRDKNSRFSQIVKEMGPEWNQVHALTNHKGAGLFVDCTEIRYVDIFMIRFVWERAQKRFVRVQGLDSNTNLRLLHLSEPIGPVERWKRTMLYGFNIIDAPRDGYLKLLFKEVLQPFYIFQAWSFVLWFCTQYYYFAAIVSVLAMFSLGLSIWETRRTQEKLMNTIRADTEIDIGHPVHGVVKESSTKLVPGDVIYISPAGSSLSCDAVIIHGSVIVNECMVTGESIPVMKTMVPNRDDMGYDEKIHGEYTIYGGTKIIQAKSPDDKPVTAVVLRTAYATKKGRLVESILSPVPQQYTFERDSIRFILILATVAIIGVIINLVRLLQFGESGSKVFLNTADITTIIVPPALPAAIAISTFLACQRLRSKSIFCVRQRSINVGGSIDLVCLDKTGTLTEVFMDINSIVRVENGKFVESGILSPANQRPPLLREGMAVCHALVKIDGVLSGDPQEVKMFQTAAYRYEEMEGGNIVDFIAKVTPDEIDAFQVGIIKVFAFSSEVRRSAVVTQVIGSPVSDFYCKGSPETILTLCNPSTVPCDFSGQLKAFTKKGFRVMAMAHRVLDVLPAEGSERACYERNLTFLGLIVFINPVRSDTSHVIDSLSRAKIRSTMITGDNIDTALSVAIDCHMIKQGELVIQVKTVYEEDIKRFVPYYNRCDTEAVIESKDAIITVTTGDDYHLAVDGDTLDEMRTSYPDDYWKVLVCSTIFARTSPVQKQQIVNDLQTLGYRAAMVGDGANDCSALKAAHAGIAITESEASVASSFTSTKASIGCVLEIIKECRCALVTAFGMFQFISVYSLIQFMSVMILRDSATSLSDSQFLIIDVMVTIQSCVYGFTRPYQGDLHTVPPFESLVAFGPMLSIVVQFLIAVTCQIGSLLLLSSQPWFIAYGELQDIETNGFLSGDFTPDYETTTIFLSTLLMYIVIPITFSKGKPHRRAFYTNLPLMFFLILFTAASAYMTLYPADWLVSFMELRIPENAFFFQLQLLGIGGVFVCGSLLLQWILTNGYISGLCVQLKERVLKTRKKIYEDLFDRLHKNVAWEPNHHLEI